jgi:hypothetical protein
VNVTPVAGTVISLQWNSYISFMAFLTLSNRGNTMASFREELQAQRWDDHRYYHHSRINQSLHLLSALCFIVAYIMLFQDPVMAALIAWLIAMISRQSGHFFFEPKGYDAVNHATHEHKEAIKVGYNLRRKVVLHVIWALVPVVLWLDPHFFGVFAPARNSEEFIRHVGAVWLVLGIVGLLLRTVHLFFIRDVRTGLVWFTKIVTDPFNDVRTYWKAPFHLLRGELIDPMHHVQAGEQSA